MRQVNAFRIVAVGFLLMVLVSASTYAAGTTSLAAQAQPPDASAADGQMPDTPPPEIRAEGLPYNYLESQAVAGETVEWKDGVSRAVAEGPIREWQDVLSPLAVEGQPRPLDWTPVRRVAVRPGYSQTLYAAIHNGYGLWRSTNGGAYWEQMPFGVGSGRTIVFANSTTAIATFGDWDGAKYANGGIWRTTDGGNTWQDVSAGIANTVVAVAFDPINTNRVYAGTYQGGIYRGDYSGGAMTWTQKNSGLADTYIYSIAVAPSNPSILYAGGYTWVYRSTNSGDTWAIADDGYPSYYTEALAVSPGDANTFYAGAQRLAGVSASGLTVGGFFKSTTGAGTGSLVLKNSGMQDTFVLDIAQDPHNSSILYAGTWGSGFFRSDNGGLTWTPKNAGLEMPYIYGIEAVPHPTSPGNTILYVATFYTGAGVFVSTDRGETWVDPWGGAFPSMFDITTTSDAYHLAAATGYGVLTSPDGGANWWWSQNLTGSASGIVLELARDPSNSSKLLAATYGGGIWTSTNAGQSWTETSTGIGGGAYVYDVTFRPGSSTTAYAGSWGAYRSTNGGSTWAALGTLSQWVRDVDALGSPSYDLFAGTHDAGVYKSPGATGTWTNITGTLPDHRIRSLKALASNQVFAGTSGSSAWEYTGVWTKRGPYILAPGVIQIAIHPTTSTTIYAATDQGVYKSTNGGESWVPKNQGLGGYGDLVISGISIDPSNPSTIYLATWGYGIFKSTDSGDHWTRLADPLKCSKVYLPVVLRNYVGVSEQVILSETFEGTFPGSWTVGDANSSDGLYYWAKRNCRPYAGSYSGWAAGAGSTYLACGSNYKINQDSWMIKGPFGLADASGAELKFKLWLNSELSYDGVCRYASTDGTNFSGLCTTGSSGGWIDRVLDLSSYAGQPNVWIALRFISDASVTYAEGAYVDNIEVRKWTGSRDVTDLGAPAAVPDTLREEPATFTRP